MWKIKDYKVDTFLLSLILFLGFISIITINSTSSILSNASSLAFKQGLWYLVGFIIILVVLKIKNEYFFRITNFLYILFNILLFLLLIFGTPINNAKCWFTIPGIGAFQPSEFMKIILILKLSIYINNYKLKYSDSIKNEFKLIFNTFLIVLIPSILTFLEPDTGNVLIYFIIYITILFMSGIRYRWFFIGIFSVLLLVGSILFIYFFNQDMFISLFGTSFFLRIDRLLDWKDGSGYQLLNGLVSIGSGGMFGYGNIPLYFPEAEPDFIFASYASIWGFLGTLFILLIILLLDYKIIKIGFTSKQNINKYLIAGIVGMLFYQQVQNISMTFGLLPITGITLPFISYGGSSLICYMFLVGIVLNISRENKKMLNYKHL